MGLSRPTIIRQPGALPRSRRCRRHIRLTDQAGADKVYLRQVARRTMAGAYSLSGRVTKRP